MAENEESSARESRRAQLAADVAAQLSGPRLTVEAWTREWPALALFCAFAVGVAVARAVTSR